MTDPITRRQFGARFFAALASSAVAAKVPLPVGFKETFEEAFANPVWLQNDEYGYFFSPSLSRELKRAVEPYVQFRQFCDAQSAMGNYENVKFTITEETPSDQGSNQRRLEDRSGRIGD